MSRGTGAEVVGAESLPEDYGDPFLHRRFRELKTSGSTTLETPTPFDLTKWLQETTPKLLKEYEEKRGKVTDAEKAALAERQRLLPPAISKVKEAAGAPIPAPPEEKPEPAVPSTEARPFLSGEGKNALQQVVAGLGLLVTAAAGGKAPAAALGALTGAMTGWAEGDAARATRDWQQYEGLVARMNRENQAALRKYERSIYLRGGHLEDAKILFEADLANAGLLDHAAEVAGKDFLRLGQEFRMIETILTKEQTERHKVNKDLVDWMNAQTRAAMVPIAERRVAAYEKGQTAGAAVAGRRAKIAGDLSKVDQQTNGLRQRLDTLDQIESAVTLLDKEGVIPRSGTKQEIAAAYVKLNFLMMNRPDVAEAIQTIRRWGTSSLVGRELELQMGKVAAMRFGKLAEAEAGGITEINKPFWDKTIEQMRSYYKKNLSVLNAQHRELSKTLQALRPEQGETEPRQSLEELLHEFGATVEPEP